MTLRTTQAVAEYVSGGAAAAPVRVTETTLQYLSGGETPHHKIRATQITAQVLMRRPQGLLNRRFTQVALQVLASRTPSFKWNDMLVYEVFPTDIGFNSSGADRFATDVVVVDSGADQRSSRWDQPLMEFDVTYGVRTVEQLQKLRAFFRVVRGRRDSFLYFDWLDHSSLEHATVDAISPDEPTPTDQFIGTGDGTTLTFQLQKRYQTPEGVGECFRPITKPIEGSTVIAINGAQVTNFSVDKFTGLVTFTPRWSFPSLPHLTIQNIIGDGADLVSPTAFDSAIQIGERVVMSGWANGANNFGLTGTTVVNVNDISPDRKTIRLNSTVPNWVAEADRSGISFAHHPAPINNATITAGFNFYVPVRFDTDKLPITLDDYGTGGAADVKLIEVRPYDL